MSLKVYTGPMFCGKTTKMLYEITKFCDISNINNTLIINNIKDNRDINNIISSHSSAFKGITDKITIISASNLMDVDISKYLVIGIDECNFFEDLILFVEKCLDLDKHIICVGLDGNHKMGKFGHINELLHLSDSFIKLSAFCSICLKETIEKEGIITPDRTVPAPFTKKLVDDGIIEDIGGAEKYISVCRKHHREG